MKLAVHPPVLPMLAQLVGELPLGEDLLYEPKWDGFRCIVFFDGASVYLQSRNLRPLDRYFPELVHGLGIALPKPGVYDGEIIVASEQGLDFEALLQRIHPAESRVRLLAERTPASFVVFDLLALESDDWRGLPFGERRAALQRLLAQPRPPVHLTPATRDARVAGEWFRQFEGAGLDGVVAKPLGLPYVEDKRVMFKVKHARTADCVVGGTRPFKGGRGVGSLLLGLYDAGQLQHVGVASGFSAQLRLELERELAPLRAHAREHHPWLVDEQRAETAGLRIPGGPSRWTGDRSLEWDAVEPVRVVEVAYDHLQGARFRHATHFVRWRPDRDARSCTYDQLEEPVPFAVKEILREEGRAP